MYEFLFVSNYFDNPIYNNDAFFQGGCIPPERLANRCSIICIKITNNQRALSYKLCLRSIKNQGSPMLIKYAMLMCMAVVITTYKMVLVTWDAPYF